MAVERHGSQVGPLDSILRTRGRFSIRTLPSEASQAFDVGLQVSRNLFQYFAADSQIVGSTPDVASLRGNVISVAVGEDFPPPVPLFDTIAFLKNHGLALRKSNGQRRVFGIEKGLGAIFLRPLPGERTELVIWGYDDPGLRQAARLVPMLTGVGQPEFIIVNKSCAWEGAAGVHAMGSFDSFWNVSEASFVS